MLKFLKLLHCEVGAFNETELYYDQVGRNMEFNMLNL
jgi:hypothetical protein